MEQDLKWGRETSILLLIENYRTMKLIRKSNYHPTLPTFFDDFFTRDVFRGDPGRVVNKTNPAVNICEDDNAYSIEMAAPGLSKEDFILEVENDLMSISFDKKEEKEEEGEGKNGKFTRREFNYTSFKRSFSLPEGHVNVDEINAKYEDGLLKLTIPKLEEVKSKAKKTIDIG